MHPQLPAVLWHVLLSTESFIEIYGIAAVYDFPPYDTGTVGRSGMHAWLPLASMRSRWLTRDVSHMPIKGIDGPNKGRVPRLAQHR